MASQPVLINGNLLSVSLDPVCEIKGTFCCDIHVVNVGTRTCIISIHLGTFNPSQEFTVDCGGVALVRNSEQMSTTITFREVECPLNFTERLFTSTVRNTLQHRNEGAVHVSKFLQDGPMHAKQILACMNDVNTFRCGGETLCVSKSKHNTASNKQQQTHRCPKICKSEGISDIAQKSCAGDAAWKQCGASFSMMMRHFQRSPALFKWHSNSKKQTIITM